MPNNQTSVSMKRQLAMALKKRLAAAPLEKITIKELTDDCGVNRQTFYYHFEDIYDLLKWLFQEEALNVMKLQDESVSWQESLGKLLTYLSENRGFCVSVLNSIEHRHIKHFLMDYMEILTRKVIYSYGVTVDDADPENAERWDFFVKFYSHAAASMLESRLIGELKLSDEKFIEYIEFLVINNIKGIRGGQNKSEE